MSDKKKDSLKIEVCTGSHCAEHKGNKIAKRLKECLEEMECGDSVKVKKCDCMKHCKNGPIVEIPGRKRVFENVKPKDAAAIVKAALERD